MKETNRCLEGYILAGAAAFLYLQLFILPNVPMLPSGDQTLYLLDGWRLLDGEVMYRDFFQFNVPGSETAWCTLFYLFGVRVWVVNAALICLGVGFAWTSVVISRKLFTGPSIILPGFLFLAIAFRNAPINVGSHHWYSTLAVMTALAVLIDKRSPLRLAFGGALCGVSAWFNQPRGLFAVLGVGVFLLWECKERNEAWRLFVQREACLLGSFLITFAGLNSYFVWKAGIKNFIYCTFVFVMKYYPTDPGNTLTVYGADLPSIEKWYSTPQLGTWLVVEFLVPGIYFLFCLRAWRERKTRPQEPWDRLMLISIVGLCLFLSVAPAAANYRLCTVALPAFILLVWFAKWPGKIERVALPLLWAGLLALMIAETHSIQTRWHGTLDLPVGRVASFSPNDTEPFQWFLSHLKPPDLLFAPPFLNFALGLQNPAPVDFLTTSDYTRPEQVRSVVDALEAKRARWVEWGPDLCFQEGPQDHLGPLRAYLRVHYHVVKTVYDGNAQILERNRR